MAAYTASHLSNDDVVVAQLDLVVEIQSWLFLRRGNFGSTVDEFSNISNFMGIPQPIEAEVSVY